MTSVKFKPAPWLTLQIGPGYNRNDPVAQWVTSVDDPLATATYGGRHVFARLHQDELSMTTRLNWILSPRLSLQLHEAGPAVLQREGLPEDPVDER